MLSFNVIINNKQFGIKMNLNPLEMLPDRYPTSLTTEREPNSSKEQRTLPIILTTLMVLRKK